MACPILARGSELVVIRALFSFMLQLRSMKEMKEMLRLHVASRKHLLEKVHASSTCCNMLLQ